MSKMGPNDARRVVWAIGEFFSSLFFLFITNVLSVLGPCFPIDPNTIWRSQTSTYVGFPWGGSLVHLIFLWFR